MDYIDAEYLEIIRALREHKKHIDSSLNALGYPKNAINPVAAEIYQSLLKRSLITESAINKTEEFIKEGEL